jgi:SAM-dependent methyltransferase
VVLTTGVPRAAGGDHPDRVRWNARFRDRSPTFTPHPLVAEVRAAGLPPGPVLELACGRSGSALALAATGRAVTAVDISDVALAQLADEARRRGLAGHLTCVEADAPAYRPAPRRYALVLATRYWDPDAFRAGCGAVAPGGLLAWESLSGPVAAGGPRQPWHVPHGQLGTRLPAGFDVLVQRADRDDRHRFTTLLARRRGAGGAH